MYRILIEYESLNVTIFSDLGVHYIIKLQESQHPFVLYKGTKINLTVTTIQSIIRSLSNNFVYGQLVTTIQQELMSLM